MTLEQISLLAQAVGAIGVVASLIFVGLQIMDNSRAVRSATAQAVHDNYASWYVAMSKNEGGLAVSTKGFVDLESLTPAEKAQFICIFMAFMSHSQNAFHQWREGHLTANLVNTPGGAAFWRERCYVFGQDFQDYVLEIMARTPDPRARAFGVVPAQHVSSNASPLESKDAV